MKPIELSQDQILAAFDDRLSQMRMPIEPQPIGDGDIQECDRWPNEFFQFHQGERNHSFMCPYGVVGDRLWVREKYKIRATESGWQVMYNEGSLKLTGSHCDKGDIENRGQWKNNWRTAGRMPQWASRITLEIVGVRVERLQEMNESDAFHSGIERIELTDGIVPGLQPPFNKIHPLTSAYMEAYHSWWDKQHGQRHPWSSNPWCWVLDVKPVE